MERSREKIKQKTSEYIIYRFLRSCFLSFHYKHHSLQTNLLVNFSISMEKPISFSRKIRRLNRYLKRIYIQTSIR